MFHLVLAALFVAWIAGTPYGITWSEGWWWPWTGVDGFVLFVVGVICLAVAPVAALLEVAAVVHGVRWLARLPAACRARVRTAPRRPVRRAVPATGSGRNVADTRFAAFHRSLYGRSAGR